MTPFRHSGARAKLASPESILAAVRGAGFRARPTQVGSSRLGQCQMPISGKPEIGRPSRNDAVVGALTALALAFSAAPRLAQSSDYPNRVITIVAPSAPGGLYSLFARVLGNRLEQRLGKS